MRLKKILSVCLLASAVCVFLQPVRVMADEADGQTVIGYENLKELLKEGNQSLKSSYDSYYDNVKMYEEMRDTLKWEQLNLEGKADQLKDTDAATASMYESNAAQLKNSSSQLNKQIKSMNEEKSLKSLERSANAMTITAQSLMNSYNQMACRLEAGRKSAEAQRSAYSSALLKLGMGAATQAEVLAAEKSLNQAENSLASLEENAARLREQLLSLLGIEDSGAVVIGAIPEPDLAEIDAIDFAADQVKAVNNNSSVQTVRHGKAKSTASRSMKQKNEETAVGEASISIESTYQTLLSKRAEYQAALEAFESAAIQYETLKKRQAAGMTGNTAYLQGEAAFLEKKAAKEIAGMALYQAYEAYHWEVKGY